MFQNAGEKLRRFDLFLQFVVTTGRGDDELRRGFDPFVLSVVRGGVARVKRDQNIDFSRIEVDDRALNEFQSLKIRGSCNIIADIDEVLTLLDPSHRKE